MQYHFVLVWTHFIPLIRIAGTYIGLHIDLLQQRLGKSITRDLYASCVNQGLCTVFIWRGPSLVYHFYWKDSLTITRCTLPEQSCLSCSMTSASFAAVARMKEYGDISCINWCEAYLSCGEGTWLVNKGETHALQHIQSWHSIQDIEHRSNWTCTYWRPFQIICTNLKRCVFQCVQIICNTFYVNELIFSRLSAPIWNVVFSNACR